MKQKRQAILTVDLGFGDAGKGSIVDYLCHTTSAHTVVRYNGGAQAGHRVVTADPVPREHVFSQFGSGTLAGAGTYLSRFMLLEPLAMMQEAEHLRLLGIPDPFATCAIDERAVVITPFHRAINRLRELARGAERHGSCGIGVGETMYDFLRHGEQVLMAGDLREPDRVRAKLTFLQRVNRSKLGQFAAVLPDGEQSVGEREWLFDAERIDWLLEEYRDFAARACIVAANYLSGLLQRRGTVIFEGAQGVLLDEWVGFHPHTTWGTTTLSNAHHLLREAAFDGDTTTFALTRAYATRHGAGPFITEEPGLASLLPDARNGEHPWQEGFRVGWLDLLMLRYALEATGQVDYLAVTCLDRLAALPALKICRRYLGDGVIERIEHSPEPRCLTYQSQLTERLRHYRPVLEPVDNIDALVQILEQELRIPVGLLSLGPTARDKLDLRDRPVPALLPVSLPAAVPA